MTDDAKTQMEEAAATPTLDDYMRRDPADLSGEDYLALIEIFRAKRVEFLAKEQKKADKKEGITDE